MIKFKKKEKFITTYTLYTMLEKKDNPNLIIGFIYKNLYKLIDEIDYFPDEAEFVGSSYHFESYLNRAYTNYYKEILSNHNWLKTLFISPIPCFNYKKFYQGLVGRLFFFSQEYENIPYNCYFYGDQTDWTVSYYIYINKENNLIQERCKFIFLKNYNSFRFWFKTKFKDDKTKIFLLCNYYFLDPLSITNAEAGLYSSKKKIFWDMIKEYQRNVELEYAPILAKALSEVFFGLSIDYNNLQLDSILNQIDLILLSKENELDGLKLKYNYEKYKEHFEKKITSENDKKRNKKKFYEYLTKRLVSYIFVYVGLQFDNKRI